MGRDESVIMLYHDEPMTLYQNGYGSTYRPLAHDCISTYNFVQYLYFKLSYTTITIIYWVNFNTSTYEKKISLILILVS